MRMLIIFKCILTFHLTRINEYELPQVFYFQKLLFDKV